MYPTEIIDLSNHNEPTDGKHRLDNEESKGLGNIYLTKLTFTLPSDQQLPSLCTICFKCAMTTDSGFDGFLPTLSNKKDSESEQDLAIRTLIFELLIRVYRN